MVRTALLGTPAALKNPSEEAWVADEMSSRRKSTPGDQSMRRSIQELVLSIDPNIKIEPEVEDVRRLLLSPPPPLVLPLTCSFPFLSFLSLFLVFYSTSIASLGYRGRVHRLGH